MFFDGYDSDGFFDGYDSEADEFVTLRVEDCHFTQDSVSCRFRNGQFAGKLLDHVIEQIEEGDVDPDDMGLTVFEHNGTFYTFNNRTLYVLKAANVNVVRAQLWNRPNNYRQRLGHGLSVPMR
mmetsp:Transcript_9887/g.19066  ORF Transcript_9887/g.19066 Transcript_9887/m.19066 type:complete len:123 (+) Transcript_9887:14-382(+)|eukprot:CAMPEP_0172762702 /NCGR_PEP_ID=MMETSP1074-20121228/174012_1 /TAXON_ID=2916 /ORGANISM="Ceratium fusus, Strain PA161109" /LENGTH=122 /DNA_ID=CAMNT_0013597151 /DNA_START=8 /DNA_END=376 /DNA_ORIENTATION=-